MSKINVEQYIKDNFKKEKIDDNPILSGMMTNDFSPIRTSYSQKEIKTAYRELSKMFHPNSVNIISESKDNQKEYAIIFQKIHSIYQSLEDSNQIKARNIPYAIDNTYYNPKDEDEPDKIIKEYGLDDWAYIFKRHKNNNNFVLGIEDLKIKEMTNPEEVKDFFDKWQKRELNPNFSHTEFTLEYGFVDDFVSCHTPGPVHTVSLKHLIDATNDFSHDMQENEWIIVDRFLSIGERIIENNWNYTESKYNIKKYDIKNIKRIAGIEPKTVVMRMEYNDEDIFFICRSPYHKFLLPKDDSLIPINQYPNANGTELIKVNNNRDLPETLEGINLQRMLGDASTLHIPWVCLKTEEIKTIKNYAYQELAADENMLIG